MTEKTKKLFWKAWGVSAGASAVVFAAMGAAGYVVFSLRCLGWALLPQGFGVWQKRFLLHRTRPKSQNGIYCMRRVCFCPCCFVC